MIFVSFSSRRFLGASHRQVRSQSSDKIEYLWLFFKTPDARTLTRMEKKCESSRWLSPTPTQSTKVNLLACLATVLPLLTSLQNFLKQADQLFQGHEIRREIISMMSKAHTPMRKKHSSPSSTSSSTYLLLHTITTRSSKLPKPQSTCRSRMPALCSSRSSYVDDKYIRSIRSNSVKMGKSNPVSFNYQSSFVTLFLCLPIYFA